MDSALVLFIAKEIPQLSLDEFKEVRVLHFADVVLALHWGSGKMGRSRALDFSSYPAVSVPVLVYIDIDVPEPQPLSTIFTAFSFIIPTILQDEAALERFARALTLAVKDSERAEIYFQECLFIEEALLDFTWACRLNRLDLIYREARKQLQREQRASVGV